MTALDLPIRFEDRPHWRVIVRPTEYVPSLLPSLAACLETIRQTKVSLRGWPYPALSEQEDERGQGDNWVASWTDFMGHEEYWRLYQSGQFVHLFLVGEASRPDWRARLESTARAHQSYAKDRDWSVVKGYISILNFLYTVTEIFEFAARLSGKGVLRGEVEISIALNNVKGFVLTAEIDRAWPNFYIASQDVIRNTWNIPARALVAESAAHSIEAVIWFFERFGWLEPARQVLAEDQANFLKKRL